MFENKVTDVFFDLDHTLWDFDKNSALTFEKIFNDHKVGVELQDFLEVYVPANLKFWRLFREDKITKSELRYQRLKSVFDTMGHPATDDLIHLLSEEYINHLSSFNALFPNAISVLDYLQPKYKLHIITNGFQEVQDKKLRNSGIHSYFDQIIDSEMAGAKKPNPVIFNMALNRAGVVPEKSIMIGDSLEADILGAKSLGFHTIHFNAHREETHDLAPIIYDLQEIKSFL
ncbi:YjjG family noncanonical pyrimidine nucleotidase [Maribacter sp. 1_MG-2023]|uniref:YjjG family noncanonical pyrimidine nucleotidase n=1 Tax=Maribacter sp. 1_MG-2023 TaxID=3062677 RepID=UPI0026E24CE7|nr:YjjG family noncanonical pyrimidine nucleotidase [Maribacter sp. 1_MG-2023]MDO6470134.1 YjjG family noncanonical pyrimidine nucleotidase [Maribacter sp. 1_MG-2023]